MIEVIEYEKKELCTSLESIFSTPPFLSCSIYAQRLYCFYSNKGNIRLHLIQLCM